MKDAIAYVSHANIDKQKWDSCIHGSINGLIYATGHYLDAMTPGWDALVYGNYEAVLPITWRSKMGFKYVCQPAFAQQLGVFYVDEKYRVFIPDFLSMLEKEYKLVEIFLNYDNVSEQVPAKHQNFLLPLNDSYETIRSNYKTDLLKNLKRTEKFNFKYVKRDEAAEAIRQYKAAYALRMRMRDEDFIAFEKLVSQFMQKEQAFIRAVTLPSGQLLSIAVFLKDDKRIYNIASTTLPDGRTMEANHFLMDELIREFAGSGLLLDFEGSDLPGVARFYQKFSPISQSYAFWKSNRLPAWMKWLKGKR